MLNATFSFKLIAEKLYVYLTFSFDFSHFYRPGTKKPYLCDMHTIFRYCTVIHSIMYIMFCAKKTLLNTKLQELAMEQYLKGALGV